ncbi:MAG: HpcH/HpaI aldolase/citrate lyase family protein [Caulobacteraceae bacterium]
MQASKGGARFEGKREVGMSGEMFAAQAAPRSVLYTPASNARAIDKARTLPCDAVFLDLEDAVAPIDKAMARENAARAVREGGFGDRLLVIRCNHHDSVWGAEDWAMAAESSADAVLAPKIATAADVDACNALLAKAPAGLRLWAMIETASAILNLREIGARAADTRLQGMIAGCNDLMLELRCQKTPDRAPLQPLLALTVTAARANGLWVFDGVFNDFSDAAGFEAEGRQALDFGFDGKTLIHPSQIDACNRIFTPPAERVAWAEKVVTAFAAPDAPGVLSLDGKMVERLHLEEARRVLALTGPRS